MLTAVSSSQVERLEAARQQALTRWHQPSVGRSTRAGISAGPNLYAEASAAAWSEPKPPGPQAAMAGTAGPPGVAAPPAAPGGSHGTVAGFQRASDVLHGVPQQAPRVQLAAVEVEGAAAAGGVGASARPSQPAWPNVTDPATAPRPALAALLASGVAQGVAAPAARPLLDDDDHELAEPALDNYRPMSGAGAPAFATAGTGAILPAMQRRPAAVTASAERRACSMNMTDTERVKNSVMNMLEVMQGSVVKHNKLRRLSHHGYTPAMHKYISSLGCALRQPRDACGRSGAPSGQEESHCSPSGSEGPQGSPGAELQPIPSAGRSRPQGRSPAGAPHIIADSSDDEDSARPPGRRLAAGPHVITDSPDEVRLRASGPGRLRTPTPALRAGAAAY